MFKKVLIPLGIALIFLGGMVIGVRYAKEGNSTKGILNLGSNYRLDELMNLLNKKYVDTLNIAELEDKTIQELLSNLDPHSSFISAKDLQRVNEPLQGNFDGIGIEFSLLNDTILVVSAIPGGPSEGLGIKSGDKIIKINDSLISGKKIENSDVTGRLRGPSGTKVKVSIMRGGKKKLIDFNITRGKIPLTSVDVDYMLNNEVGIIKISNFGANTYDEFFNALVRLKQQGMVDLILDLRGNPGGYLQTAVLIADEFLANNKLIVYTKGQGSKRREERATEQGNFENGKLTVLIDEGSASASEIVAGAVQDWDRGTIVGRRSFGKGLVQQEYDFSDGSAVRLTVARYYTPTGRSIQKSYLNGLVDYESDLNNRYKNGELSFRDSIKLDTTQKFKTPAGKLVYGGGGINPDIFVPIDTSEFSEYYARLAANDMFREFAYGYLDKHPEYKRNFKSSMDFAKNFILSGKMQQEFLQMAGKKDIKFSALEFRRSQKLIDRQVKCLMARQLYGNEGFYRAFYERDSFIAAALADIDKEKSEK